MSLGQVFGWVLIAFFALPPIGWVVQSLTNSLPPGNSPGAALLSAVISWGIAAGIWYLLKRARLSSALRRQREQLAVQEMLAAPLTEIKPRQVLLKGDEKAYAAVQASLQEMKTLGFKAGTTGVSIRVARGVTLRSAGTRGQAVKGMVAVASGELALTDRRIVFAGDLKSFAINLDDLISITPYDDGFGFGDSRSTHTVRMSPGKEHLLFKIALDKVLAQHRLQVGS